VELNKPKPINIGPTITAAADTKNVEVPKVAAVNPAQPNNNITAPKPACNAPQDSRKQALSVLGD